MSDEGSSFRIEQRDDGFAILWFDAPGRKVNTFTRATLAELGEQLDQLEGIDLRGLILASGKPGVFVAGADLHDLLLKARSQPEGGLQVTRQGQALFDRIAALNYPTVAAIDGACVGGGLELALACDYRIASLSSSTSLGQPETALGIIPGWGGTQRLPRVIGVAEAVSMIASGTTISATRAMEIELVFDAVPPERLLDESIRLLEMANELGDWKQKRIEYAQPIGLTEDQANFIFAVARAQVAAKTGGHYPAPMVAVEVMERSVNKPLEEGLKIEAEAIAPLVEGDVSPNLIRIFLADRRLAKDPGIDDLTIQPEKISRVGIIGAGLMGSGIATALIRRGVPVTLVDVADEFVQKGMARIQGSLAARVKIGRLKPEEVVPTIARVTPTTNLQYLADCQLVIEAIVENEATKNELFDRINKIVGSDTIIASNTSTISISRLSENVDRPERFVGMHFFNPADRMQLVEVIRGERTSDQTTATTVALAKAAGKTPIVVGDCAGFLVNRILMPYMNESQLLIEEGAEIADIDKAARKFGMPMGPITLHDVVGLDTALYAGRVVAEAYRDRYQESKLLEGLVEAGRLGQKSAAGFFKYGKGKRGKPDPELDPILDRYRKETRIFSRQEITDRLFFPMLLEATRALEEGIARSAEDLDMSLIHGIGFPAFRGGILRWADSVGAADLIEKLTPYQPLGKRFEPTELLRKHAQEKTGFYPDE